FQQPYGEAPGGPQARVRRQVRDGDDFEVGVQASQLHRLPDDGVLDVLNALGDLGAGVADADVFFEAVVDRDVDVLVDGGADQITAVLAVVRRQVRTAPAQGHS